MAELGILEPRVLNGIIQELDPPDDFMGHMMVGTPMRSLDPTWEYDIEIPVRGAQTTYNTPNSEARLVDHEPVGHISGGYAYVRDKKLFSPTTLRWMRAAGENEVNRRNAEMYVMKEVAALRTQHMRGEEIAIWEMFKGSWTYTHVSGHTVTVDYKLPAAHKPTASVLWDQDSATIPQNISAWKRLVSRKTGYMIQTAYLNSLTMSIFIEHPDVVAQLSEMQKHQYTTERTISRFYGINWVEYDGGYTDINNNYQPYIPDRRILFIAPGMGDVASLMYGPSADHDAPAGHTGPFAKTWLDPDPSAMQYLLENHYMPFLRRPDQIVYATV